MYNVNVFLLLCDPNAIVDQQKESESETHIFVRILCAFQRERKQEILEVYSWDVENKIERP